MNIVEEIIPETCVNMRTCIHRLKGPQSGMCALLGNRLKSACIIRKHENTRNMECTTDFQRWGWGREPKIRMTTQDTRRTVGYLQNSTEASVWT